MKYPEVSIITINYNGLKDTIECLNSLKKINYPNYEIFVVDNASENNEGDKLKEKFKDNIRLIKSKENTGFAGGNNLAIRQIIKENKSKYICLLNNDTVVDKDFLKYLVEKAEEDIKIGSVMPQSLQYYNKNLIDSCGLSYYKSGLSFIRNANLKKDSKISNTLFSSDGVCSLYDVSALKSVRYKNEYFDEDFFMYAEDLDLGFRLLHRGYIPEFTNKSIIYHKRSSSSGLNSDFARYYGLKNTLLVIYKNYSNYYIIWYIIPIIIMQIGMLLLYIKRRKLYLLLKSYFGFFMSIRHICKKRQYILKNSNITNKYLLNFFEKPIFPYNYIHKLIYGT